jgi:hypothetical protein
MEAQIPRAEALHTNHRWFTELQPAHDRARPWIRILRLEPGAFGDPIHGLLTVEELDATETFDALSYCCGPPILSCTITVNGAPGFRITQNLWNALQRVRKKDGDRRLWVDAVCIDQEDEREKSSQVRHMHAVYSRAEEVCIYWGECTDQGTCGGDGERIYMYTSRDSVDQNGHDLDPGDVGRFLACRKPLCITRVPKMPARSSIEHTTDRQSSQLILEGCTLDVWEIHPWPFVDAVEYELVRDSSDVASRQQCWWMRLWTMQELLLAKQPVVYCGPYVIRWETVSQLWVNGTSITKRNYDGGYSTTFKESASRLEITNLNALCDRSRRDLHTLLMASTEKGFAEPKDRVFALLGALPQRTISLDYALDTRVIYASTAVHCIATQGTFDILFSQWKRSYRLESEENRLYSLVPDFDRLQDSNVAQSWSFPRSCVGRPEQGRWEGARASTVPNLLGGYPRKHKEQLEFTHILSGRNINMAVIENTVSRFRIAFDGADVATISKMYHLGQHNLDWILADLSNLLSQYFAGSLCEGNKHWTMNTTSQQEQHTYDIYTLLLEACSLHEKGESTLSSDAETHIPVSMDLRFEAQRQRESIQNTRKTLHGPKECLDFLAIADECLRRPWEVSLTGPLASRRCDWTKKNRQDPSHPSDPKFYSGKSHKVLQTLLFAVMSEKSWSGTFFITTDGYLGIVPESTQPGDQIVILDGARSPFVLRALKDSSDYTLLGDSFVLGLMHGEVREMDARGKLESRKFVIQ